jgi:DNA mismatch endonuclease (patch repair protein)
MKEERKNYDVMSVAQRSKLMAKIRNKNTKPELMLRRAVWALGIRYRIHLRIGKTRPDLIFVKPKVAIFIDGCFWHKCPLHYIEPKGNREFWERKISDNVSRDIKNTESLKSEGWTVLRFWEHQLLEDSNKIALEIIEIVSDKRKKDRKYL